MYTTRMIEIIRVYGPQIIAALAVVVVLLAALMIRLELRVRRLTHGANGASLEGVIQRIVTDMSAVQEHIKRLSKTSAELRALLRDSVRGVSVIRFNALTGDTSGKQSFATAIVSEAGNGIVISSLHAREHARVYAKSLKNFSSEVELTGEEKQAIVEARKHLG